MSSAWAAVVIAAASAGGAALATLARMSARWSRLEERMKGLADQIQDLGAQLREDRNATNARLTWLERQIVWRLGGRPRGRDDTDH